MSGVASGWSRSQSRSLWPRFLQTLSLVLGLLLMGGEVGAGQAHHFTAASGMQVYLVESHAVPMMEVTIMTPGGSQHEPEKKAGLASLTAWMMNEGGGDYTPEAFQERLEFYGIDLSGSAGRDVLELSMTTLSENAEIAWAMLGDAVLRPRFDQEAFERARRERRAELIKSKERPGSRASKVLYRTLYGEHPYAHPVNGTLASVENLTLEDIKGFFKQTFHGPSMVLSVAGDVTPDQLRGLIDKHLGALDSTPSPIKPPPMAQPSIHGSINHIEMNVPQTTLRIGVVGIDRHDPDFYPMIIMNQILGGGGFTSRLNEEVREKRGLTYGVFSYFSPLTARGPFVIGLETKTSTAAEALKVVHDEIEKMANKGVTDQEMADIKRYLTGSFPLRLDGLGRLSGIWARIGYYKRGLDYLDKWQDRIRAVTRADVSRVARRLLKIPKLHVVTVGKGSQPPKLPTPAEKRAEMAPNRATPEKVAPKKVAPQRMESGHGS
ncbi:MAG: insulinase family protein [Magnetococcales bacterium]|nr:insulinase family protein [Magnetococcales bacterium]